MIRCALVCIALHFDFLAVTGVLCLLCCALQFALLYIIKIFLGLFGDLEFGFIVLLRDENSARVTC